MAYAEPSCASPVSAPLRPVVSPVASSDPDVTAISKTVSQATTAVVVDLGT